MLLQQAHPDKNQPREKGFTWLVIPGYTPLHHIHGQQEREINISMLTCLCLVPSSYDIVLVRVSVAVKRHHDHDNSYKGKHFIGETYKLRGIVHYLHGEKQGGLWADMVLEKALRFLHLDRRATGSSLQH